MIKIVQKQISEKLRQKLKIENEIQEFETQFQVTEKEHTVVANLLKEKRQEMDSLGGNKIVLEEAQKLFLGQLVKKALEDKNMQAKILKLSSDIKQHEKQVE